MSALAVQRDPARATRSARRLIALAQIELAALSRAMCTCARQPPTVRTPCTRCCAEEASAGLSTAAGWLEGAA